MTRPIQIVDEQDQPVGQASKQEAWERDLPHRIVRIMLHNGSDEILLQRRHPDKDIFPNCWDNSAAGHVDAGEDYDDAATRELFEELHLTNIRLVCIGDYRSREYIEGRHFNRFTRVYRGEISQLPIYLEAGKVDAVGWFTIDTIRMMLREQPKQLTDGLRQVIEKFYPEGQAS